MVVTKISFAATFPISGLVVMDITGHYNPQCLIATTNLMPAAAARKRDVDNMLLNTIVNPGQSFAKNLILARPQHIQMKRIPCLAGETESTPINDGCGRPCQCAYTCIFF